MPSERALLLASIIDAAMAEAGYDLVQVGTAPAPTPAPPVTPVPAPAPAQPTPAPASPTVSTAWQWDGTLNQAGNQSTLFTMGATSPSVAAGPILVTSLQTGEQRAMTEAPLYIGEGDDLWTVFFLAIAPGYPVDVDTWQNFAEFKNDGLGSAPVEFGIRRGRFEVGGGMSHPAGNRSDRVEFGTVVADGQWHEFQVHTVFSSDPAKGQIDVWLDRQAAVVGFRPKGGTLYPRTRSLPRFGQNTGVRAVGGQAALRGMKIGRTIR